MKWPNGQMEEEATDKDGKKNGWVSRESSVSRRHFRQIVSFVGKIFRVSLVDKNHCSSKA